MFCQKILLLVWKNWVLRKRNKLACFCECFCMVNVLWPLIGMHVVGIVLGGASRNNPEPDPPGVEKFRTTASPFQDTRSTRGWWNDRGYGNFPPNTTPNSYSRFSIADGIEKLDSTCAYCKSNVIGLAPAPVSDSAVKFYEKFAHTISSASSRINVTTFDNESAMESYFQRAQRKKYKKKRVNFILGVVFKEGFSANETLESAKKISYKIRPNYEKLKTNELINPNSTAEKAKDFDSTRTYEESLVLPIQLLLNRLLIFEVTNQSNWDMSVEPFPRRIFSKEETKFSIKSYPTTLYSSMLLLCFISMIPAIVGELVSEKESGIKELMKMAGLSEWMHWLGWLLNTVLFLLVTVSIITLLLCLKTTVQFIHTNWELVWMSLMLYGIWTCTYCFLVSAFFDKPSIAITFGIIIYIISFGGLATGMELHFKYLPEVEKLAFCLLPNVALQLLVSVMVDWESTPDKGVHWNNIHLSAPGSNNPALGYVMLMLVIGSVLNFLVCLYVDAIMPKTFGVQKSPWFIFKPSEWIECCSFLKKNKVAPAVEGKVVKENEGKSPETENKKESAAEGVDGNEQNAKSQEALEKSSKQKVQSSGEDVLNDGFEKEPEGMTAGVQIMKLRKEFGFKKVKVAVDDLTVNMFEGQIFCLLGENGAGKTTTMSILTGMISATSGTAKINGHDIHTGMEKIRNSLGLCPQHNMLFDRLNVIEHLKFFGVLKGLTFKAAEAEGKNILHLMKMTDKYLSLSPNLSGGQKRRLSLACSLMGRPKVLFLDEPSSGMDPEARRVIWDLLLTLRAGKTIILTTHFMEEADVLGDRIGIMSAGKLQCCGSPSFLKKFYGAGFCLNMTIREGAERDKILKMVERHVPGARFKESHSNTTTEVSIALPTDSSKLPGLFKELQSVKDQLKIDEIGIGWTTMDDVFVKVEELNHPILPDEDEQSQEEQVKHISEVDKQTKPELGAEKELSPPTQSKSEVIKDASTEQLNASAPDKDVEQQPEAMPPPSPKSEPNRTWSQCWGLLIKNLLIMKGKIAFIIVQALVPLLLTMGVVGIGFAFFEVPENVPNMKFPSQRSLNLSLEPYKDSVTAYFYTDNTNETQMIGAAYETILASNKKKRVKNNLEPYLTKMVNSDDNYKRHIVAAGITSYGDQIILIARYSNIAYHSAPLSVNLLINAFLQSIKGDDAYIEAAIHPLTDNRVGPNLSRLELYPTQKEYMALSYAFPQVMMYLWPIVMALFVTNFVIEPTEERISTGKLLQFMTGVNAFQYWSFYFLVDFLFSLIVISIMLLIVVTFDAYQLFTNNGGLWVLCIILVLFSVSAIPFSYLISTCVKTSSEGFKRLICIHIFGGVGLYTVYGMVRLVFAKMLIPIETFGRLLCPSFGLIKAMYSYVEISTKNLECTHTPSKYLDIVCDPAFDLNSTDISYEKFEEIVRCCSNCQPRAGRSCFELLPYYEWMYEQTFPESYKMPPLTQTGFYVDIVCFIALALIYLILLILIDHGILLKSKDILSDEIYPSIGVQDADVVQESDRVQYMVDNKLTDEDALVVSLLSRAFGALWAVSGLSFGVHHGECFGLLGVNGAGKTTAFRMLAADVKPSFGEGYMGRIMLSRDRNKFRSRLGYCPQFDGIIGILTGKEMLCLYARLRGLKGKNVKVEADKWLKKAGLTDSANVKCGKYSGGMKRRLSTAIALIADPPLILLDEPTSGVDPVARRQFWKIISSVKNAGQSIILTSHSMEECEALCNRLGIMVNGELQCFGGVQHLKTKFAQAYTMTVKLFEDFVHPEPKEIPPPVQPVPSVQSPGAPKRIGAQIPQQYSQFQKGQTSPMPNSPYANWPQNQSNMFQRPLQPQQPVQGYPMAPVAQATQVEENPEIDEVIQSIVETFDACELKDRHMTTLKFQINDVENKPLLTWDVLYSKMEETKKKNEGKIEEYAIMESTLEDVFLAFAKTQYDRVRVEAAQKCPALRKIIGC